jgi:hypothetical protein
MGELPVKTRGGVEEASRTRRAAALAILRTTPIPLGDGGQES